MKAGRAKGSLGVLAIAFALMVVGAMTVPMLASANETSGKEVLVDAANTPATNPENQPETQGATNQPQDNAKPAATGEEGKPTLDAQGKNDGNQGEQGGQNGQGNEGGQGGQNGEQNGHQDNTPINGGSGQGDHMNVHPNGPTDLTYNGQPQKPAISAECNGQPLVEGTDFTLTYVNAKTNAQSTTPPSEEGEYRIIVKGIGKYAGQESGFGFRILSENSLTSDKCRIETNPTIFDYTGKAITPNLTVTFNGKTLVQGTDYVVDGYRYKGNLVSSVVDEGRYNVAISGIGQYSGKAESRPFTVSVANSINSPKCTIKVDPEFYGQTGQPVDVKVSVTFNGSPLVQGKDYRIKGYVEGGWGSGAESLLGYAPSKEGSYAVVLEGMGNYSGETRAQFSIVNDSNFGYATLTLTGTNADAGNNASPTVEYTGNAVYPNVKIVTPGGVTLTEGKDYELKYQYMANGSSDWQDVAAPKDEGRYKVTAQAIGQNYQGSISGQSFYVARTDHDLTKATVTVPEKVAYAKGARLNSTVDEGISVTINGKPLTRGVDYTTAYDDNSGVLGIHTVTLVGAGEYYGKVQRTYGVWDEATAPSKNTRISAETGIKAEGDIISLLSTTSDGEWVGFVAQPLETSNLSGEAKEASDAASNSNALAVQAYEIDLIYSTGTAEGAMVSDGIDTASSWKLTDGFDLLLTFPVGSQYNGMTATITQIHNGEALPAQTSTVANGTVGVRVNGLSTFIVSIKPSEDSSTNGSEKASSNGKSVKPATAGTKNALAATGDAIPATTVLALVAITAMAACGLTVSRRRSNR